MAYGRGANRLSNADIHVDPAARPAWTTGVERVPAVGEQVYCTDGLAEVVCILGKTGDGSRLVELKLPVPGSKPFFAAASNILVPPETA